MAVDPDRGRRSPRCSTVCGCRRSGGATDRPGARSCSPRWPDDRSRWTVRIGAGHRRRRRRSPATTDSTCCGRLGPRRDVVLGRCRACRYQHLAPGDHIVVNLGADRDDDPLVPHFRPLLAATATPPLIGRPSTAAAGGRWVELLRGDGLDRTDDPRADHRARRRRPSLRLDVGEPGRRRPHGVSLRLHRDSGDAGWAGYGETGRGRCRISTQYPRFARYAGNVPPCHG